MATITTLFWDVGGVLLSNGWDAAARRRGTDAFSLDHGEFEERHALVSAELELGRLSLDDYLDCTLGRSRSERSTRERFGRFMREQSQPRPDSLAVLKRVAATRRYLLATLNNESLELNRYRIERFGLRRYFTAFFSSCFLGVKKPDLAIFRTALQVTQREPAECLFIDDRPANVEAAESLGMQAVHFRSAEALIEALERAGVRLEPA